MGIDISRIIESVGASVSELKVGDEVLGGCDGAFAEHVCGSAKEFARKPGTVTFEEAAALRVAGVTALQALRDHGHVGAVDRALIIGAGGGVGAFAVQIARALGAEVTAVCSTSKLDLVRSRGAAQVVDHSTEDFVAVNTTMTSSSIASGNRSLTDLRRTLTPAGTLVILGGGSGRWRGPMMSPLKAMALSKFVKRKMVF